MSRPLRIEFPGAVYHVMNRGLSQNLVFLDKQDYELFLSTLEESCGLFNVVVYAYCLMPNHYHLLIRTPSGNLSRFMRHLNGVYTQRFNRKYDRDGPLYRGRYKGILVQDDSYLIEVVRYIHKNPLKAKMVERLNHFRWSSHRKYIGQADSFNGLEPEFVLSYFSGKRKSAINRYKSFMVDKESDEIEKFYGSKKQGSILGDLDFIDRIKRKYILNDSLPDLEVREIRNIRGNKMIKKINKEVCRKFKVSAKSLSKGQRGITNIARQTAISLSKELSGLKLSEICEHYGIKSRQAVGAHFSRLQGHMIADKKFKRKYLSLKSTCSQVAT